MTNASTTRVKTAQAKSPAPNKKKSPAPLDLAPHSEETEIALLGALLIDPDKITDARDLVEPDDFFILRHGWIYEAMIGLDDKRMGDAAAFDVRLLAEKLKAQGRLDDIGGEAYLNYLPTQVPTATHAPVYAMLISRLATRRRLLGAAGDIAQVAHNTDLDLEEVIDKSEAALSDAVQGAGADGPKPISIGVSAAYDHAEKTREQGQGIGLPTGYVDVDRLTGGVEPGHVIIIAGRPGMGKSTYMGNVAMHMAISGLRVAFFSLEMMAEQIANRLIAAHASLDHELIRNGQMSDREWRRYVDAAGRVSDLSVWIDDGRMLTPQGLLTKCRRLKREHGLDALMVDYIGLMQSGQNHRDKNAEVSYISWMLHNIAGELAVPVYAASQLSRAVEQRADKRPQLSDLRDSGSLEQDADMVWFLYRDEYYNEATERPGEVDVIIAKNRHGSTGTASLLFRKEMLKMVNLRRTNIDLNTGRGYNELGEVAR